RHGVLLCRARQSPLAESFMQRMHPAKFPARLELHPQPQRGREVLRWVVLANAHASPVRLGLVLWQHALHLVPALVVQHAQSEKYLVPRITRKKSSDKRSFIWVHKIPQHVSVIIIG